MNSTDHLSELESLRSQVADLTRALAERDVSMRDLREQSNLLRTIIEGTAAETGDSRNIGAGRLSHHRSV